MQYFIHRDNKQLGPFTEGEVKAQLAAGTFSPQDLVWSQGQADWMPIEHVAAFSTSAPATPGLPPVAPLPSVSAAIPDAAAPTSSLAIWSLVCGCSSVICWPFTSIPAIILGHMGLSEIKKNPHLQGKGMALAGTILGYIFTTIVVLYFIAVVVLVALGNQVKETFKTINAQIQQAQAEAAAQNTNSDANSAASTNGSSDTSTNTPASTPDQSTNAPASTNAPPSN